MTTQPYVVFDLKHETEIRITTTRQSSNVLQVKKLVMADGVYFLYSAGGLLIRTYPVNGTDVFAENYYQKN